jgi:hypothetical protein
LHVRPERLSHSALSKINNTINYRHEDQLLSRSAGGDYFAVIGAAIALLSLFILLAQRRAHGSICYYLAVIVRIAFAVFLISLISFREYLKDAVIAYYYFRFPVTLFVISCARPSPNFNT